MVFIISFFLFLFCIVTFFQILFLIIFVSFLRSDGWPGRVRSKSLSNSIECLFLLPSFVFIRAPSETVD